MKSGAGGWGNGEAQVYTDSPSIVFQDGQSHLVIRATGLTTPGGRLPATKGLAAGAVAGLLADGPGPADRRLASAR